MHVHAFVHVCTRMDGWVYLGGGQRGAGRFGRIAVCRKEHAVCWVERERPCQQRRRWHHAVLGQGLGRLKPDMAAACLLAVRYNPATIRPFP